MDDRPAGPRKKAVNLSIDAQLAADAKEFGTNMSAVLEKGLKNELRAQREQKWRAENQKAISDYNRYTRKHGLLSDTWRKF